MRLSIEPFRDGQAAWCEQILRALPQWFGIESALLEYVRDTRTLPTWIAWRDGEPAGFVTIRMHNPLSAEIHCMAVGPEHHRGGIGRMMIQFVEDHVRARGAAMLQVKTPGPSRPDKHYDRTRRFYESMGFFPLEEMKDLWPGNPCLIFVKPL